MNSSWVGSSSLLKAFLKDICLREATWKFELSLKGSAVGSVMYFTFYLYCRGSEVEVEVKVKVKVEAEVGVEVRDCRGFRYTWHMCALNASVCRIS